MAKSTMKASEVERIIKLSEECAEIIQACMKILHHGWDGRYHDTGETNREYLESEIGDVRAILTLMVIEQDLNPDMINIHENRKQTKLLQLTYFQEGSKMKIGE